MLSQDARLRHLHRYRRRLLVALLSHRTLLAVLWTVLFSAVVVWQSGAVGRLGLLRRWAPPPRPCPRLRPTVFNLSDFGGVGDGVTLNTQAFEKAVEAIMEFGGSGGGQLNVPPGMWLTGPFNLTSHMTLFLAEGAVIMGIEDYKHWTLMPPLPSYGQGRELKGPRYGSLIHGQNLRDVVITGYNGTINGQGQTWWKRYRQGLLEHTRGPLVQLMWSRDIVISNITLQDSPFWTLHPYDCRNVTISNVTIMAPLYDAPNTDGIDPDSCEDMVIENSYISVGDDGIAIKSGWDRYGIAYGRPSTNILVKNVVLRSKMSAGVSIGSEMSGGISNIKFENILVWDSRRGVRIKTAPGRGGYIHNISYSNLTFNNLSVGIVIKTDYNEHPDDGFDPKAIPTIRNLTFRGVYGHNVRIPVEIQGSKEILVRGISFQDMQVGLSYKKKRTFRCSYVEGYAVGPIFPAPCDSLDRCAAWIWASNLIHPQVISFFHSWNLHADEGRMAGDPNWVGS
ncbi:probable polygalacturonase isoform X4 [Musa acuminata AAA Group]|uniref:probable polygalacturonase isoform X4 n=1 Tax=Musa acuminata AAA Group TaxID=214697 RepID=UPI000511D2D0